MGDGRRGHVAMAPINARRRLGEQLQRLRKANGYTGEDVARELGWSGTKVSRIESGKVGVDHAAIRRLCGLYDVAADKAAELLGLLEDTRDDRWWLEYQDVMTSRLEEYISAEASAASITVANASLIPGLLQTRAYNTLLTEGGAFSLDPEMVLTYVEIREKRQRVLVAENPPEVNVTLSECALHMTLGNTAVFRGQLGRLLELSELDHVEIRLLPNASPIAPFLGALTLFDFPDASDASVVAVEYEGDMVFKDSPRDVRAYRRKLKHLRDHALAPDESIALLKTRMSEL